MVLSNVDRELIQRCLAQSPRAWEDFVDRFMGLIMHVVRHVASNRSIDLKPDLQEDLCAEVFLNLVRDDFAVLRRFREQSSFATYLTVVARRVVVRKLVQLKASAGTTMSLDPASTLPSPHHPVTRLEVKQDIEQALHILSAPEATAVRMFHLEGKSYRDIGSQIGLPENSVGPLLTQAREKMRQLLS